MAPTIPDHGPPPGNPQNILGPTANTDKELERTFSTISTASTLSSQDCGLEPPNHQPPLGPILSRIVTSRTNIVPRRKRRGLFANLSIIPEVENPYEYARATKKLITLVVAIAGAAAPMASAILFPALEGISEDFHAPASLTNLSVALYMLGMGIFPLWWSSFAERIGYRTIYIVSFVLYVVSNVCCAVSVNIGMFIVFRICSGASASSAQTIGAGTISNIWETKERGKAMGLFYLGPLCGPLISPIVGGLLTNRFGWRSTMWFLAAFGALAVVMMIFCLPETYREKVSGPKVTYISEKQAEVDLEGEGLERTLSKVTVKTKKKASQWIRTLKALFVDPLRSLIFIRFPPVLLTVYWASLAFGCLYILNVSIQMTFARAPYKFNTIIIGCLYIPNSLGYFIASLLGGRWNDNIMHKAAVKRQTDPDAPLEFRPEDRMGINAWVAGFMFPLSLLMYGWLVESGEFWFTPIIGTFLFGIGSMLVFSIATTMLTEFIPGKSASAVAVNNFFRNIFACVGGIITEPLIQAIGNGYLFTILCGVGLLSTATIWTMQKWGPMWREQAKRGMYANVGI